MCAHEQGKEKRPLDVSPSAPRRQPPHDRLFFFRHDEIKKKKEKRAVDATLPCRPPSPGLCGASFLFLAPFSCLARRRPQSLHRPPTFLHQWGGQRKTPKRERERDDRQERRRAERRGIERRWTKGKAHTERGSGALGKQKGGLARGDAFEPFFFISVFFCRGPPHEGAQDTRPHRMIP